MPTDHSDPTPTADRLRAALRPVDVVADRSQEHEGRVWATAFDVVRGVDIREGRPVTVGWEDDTWTAIPEWDTDEVDWLWLRPLPDDPPAREATLSGDLAASAAIALEQHRQTRALARCLLLELGERAAAMLGEELLTRLLQTARWPQPPARHRSGWTEGH